MVNQNLERTKEAQKPVIAVPTKYTHGSYWEPWVCLVPTVSNGKSLAYAQLYFFMTNFWRAKATDILTKYWSELIYEMNPWNICCRTGFWADHYKMVKSCASWKFLALYPTGTQCPSISGDNLNFALFNPQVLIESRIYLLKMDEDRSTYMKVCHSAQLARSIAWEHIF